MNISSLDNNFVMKNKYDDYFTDDLNGDNTIFHTNGKKITDMLSAGDQIAVLYEEWYDQVELYEKDADSYTQVAVFHRTTLDGVDDIDQICSTGDDGRIYVLQSQIDLGTGTRFGTVLDLNSYEYNRWDGDFKKIFSNYETVALLRVDGL